MAIGFVHFFMVQSQPLPFFFSIQIGNIDRLEILIKNQIKYDQKLLITTVLPAIMQCGGNDCFS